MRFSWRGKVWWFSAAAAAVVVAAGWWCDSEVRRAIERQLDNELQAMVQANVAALDIWIDNQLRFVEILAAEEKVRSLALAVAEQAAAAGATAAALQTSEEVQALRDYMEARLRTMRLGFVLIDPEGIILAAPLEEMLGDQLYEEALEKFQRIFTEGESKLITPYRPNPNRMRAAMKGGPLFRGGGAGGRDGGRSLRSERGLRPREGSGLGPSGLRGGGRRNRTIMAAATPIRLPGEGQEVAAAIGLMIRPEREFTRILSVARLGDSGETFAFDAGGVMLSKSRFEETLRELGLIKRGAMSALTLELRDPGGNLVEGHEPAAASWPLMRLVREAAAGNDGVEVKGFRDYRGVTVVGAWRWLPEHQFGVATKLDAAEAFEPLRVLRLVFLILLLLSVLCGIGLFLFSYFNTVLRRRMEEVALEAQELGQYTLVEKIGEGGMGAVYRARHALLRRETAVKLLLPDKANERAVQRFEREVQLTCRLVHPNTIQIFDYGHTPEGIFYYAMEFLNGVNLRELIQTEKRLSEGRTIHILEQICASLSEAHEAGLVHRDIKPANVILCDRGGLADMVKVLDFGLVKPYRGEAASATEATHTWTITGTPQFISPEAVSRPEQVDQRSDLYALGALGYYLLTGSHLFGGESPFEVMQKHVSRPPEPPRQRLGATVDADLETLILQCLEKEPVRRPQSARAVIAALRQSPACGAWTAGQAADWWTQFRERCKARQQKSPPAPSEPTLQIYLGERTRVVK